MTKRDDNVAIILPIFLTEKQVNYNLYKSNINSVKLKSSYQDLIES